MIMISVEKLCFKCQLPDTTCWELVFDAPQFTETARVKLKMKVSGF